MGDSLPVTNKHLELNLVDKYGNEITYYLANTGYDVKIDPSKNKNGTNGQSVLPQNIKNLQQIINLLGAFAFKTNLSVYDFDDGVVTQRTDIEEGGHIADARVIKKLTDDLLAFNKSVKQLKYDVDAIKEDLVDFDPSAYVTFTYLETELTKLSDTLKKYADEKVDPDELNEVLDDYLLAVDFRNKIGDIGDKTVKEYIDALRDSFPEYDLSNYITYAILNDRLGAIPTLTVKEYIDEIKESIPDIDPSTLATVKYVESKLGDIGNLTVAEYVNNAVNNIPGVDLTNYVTFNDLSRTIGTLDGEELDVTAYIKKKISEIDLSGYVTSFTLNNILGEIPDGKTVSGMISESLRESKEYTDEKIASITGGVVWKEYY